MLESHPNLVEFVKQGNVVLFLGAGASLSASDGKGDRPPLAGALGEKISTKFLGGAMSGASLAEIAECAISDSNTATVQEYIKEVFSEFSPGVAHKLLPRFSWAGIATTNYDLYVESGYAATPSPIQRLRPVVYDEQVKRIIETPNDLPYLKLHGCFDHMGPGTVPLVLSLDQYLDFEKGRKSLFDTFEEWARRYTFVFIGYGAQDLNIRRYITRLVENVEDRMRFYFVRPGWQGPERRMWETRKVTAIDADFNSFMEALDAAVGSEFRGLRIDVKMPPALRNHFVSTTLSLSENASLYFQNDAVFIESVESESGAIPKNFFDGNSSGWAPILKRWDATRDVAEDLIIEVFLDDHQSEKKDCELILLRGYAGAGKTVTLKRLGWELVNEHGGIGIYIERPEDLNSGAIAELVELTRKRIYVFIDDVSTGFGQFRDCVSALGSTAQMVTFVGGIRSNDWNRLKSRFSFIATREYELGDLTQSEILGVIERLETYGCLGELEDLSRQQRVERFRDVAQRNLLVALYEATRGLSFEEIILNEFETLISDEARAVYLTICMLNRLNVPVRATLISRIHSLPYEDFRSRLFKPLEGVVNNRYDKLTRDYVYAARHPYIAEIVFRTVLVDQNDRFEEYFRVLKMLNMAYQSDEIAFKELVRGRVLNDLFSDTKYVEKIFEIAEAKCQRDPNIFHQRAVFEMRRAGGDLELAQDYVDMALDARPNNSFFKHTAAELLLKRAESSDSLVVRDRLLRRAERSCKALANAGRSSHAKHTLAKIGIARANTYLEQYGNDATITSIRELIKPAQLDVESSLQTHPGDSYLLDAKAKLARVIGDSAVVMKSLEDAFDASPNISYIAMQLHSCYLEKGDFEKAGSVLKRCFEENRSNRQVNYTYGKFLMDQNMDPKISMQYLKRSFVPGDSNFDAQMRYGRECYRAAEYVECERHFSTVRATRFPPRFGADVLYPTEDFRFGDVIEVHARYLILRDLSSGLKIRAYRDQNDSAEFSKVISSMRLKYKVGVGIYGIRATQMAIADLEHVASLGI